MTLTKRSSFLYQGVMGRVGDRLRRMPLKSTQHILGDVSKQSACNARQGSIPRTDAFLSMLAGVAREAGAAAALKILEPVIGPADPAYHLAKLAEIEQSLREIRHGVTAAGLACEGHAVAMGGAVLRLADGASLAPAVSGGHAGAQLARAGASDGPARAFVSTRQPLNVFARDDHAELGRHLSSGNAALRPIDIIYQRI